MTEDKKQTALIIEDNEDNMVLMAILLQNAGYETVWAENGKTGIQQTIEKRPDFVILDIQFPDIYGNGVLKAIRNLDNDMANVIIIAMTSYAMAGDREKLLAAGCDAYIEKPIDPMHVIQQIQTVINKANESSYRRK